MEFLILAGVIASYAPAVNAIFTLGRNVKSVLEWAEEKRKGHKPGKARLKRLAPLADLVQQRVLGRVLTFAVVISVGVAVGTVSTGEFSTESIGADEKVDIGLGTAGAISGAAMWSARVRRRLVRLSPDEIAILEDYERAYQEFLREQRRDLEIISDSERKILDILPTSEDEARTVKQIELDIRGAEAAQPSRDDEIVEGIVEEIESALTWLQELGFVGEPGYRAFFRTSDGTKKLERDP